MVEIHQSTWKIELNVKLFSQQTTTCNGEQSNPYVSFLLRQATQKMKVWLCKLSQQTFSSICLISSSFSATVCRKMLRFSFLSNNDFCTSSCWVCVSNLCASNCSKIWSHLCFQSSSSVNNQKHFKSNVHSLITFLSLKTSIYLYSSFTWPQPKVVEGGWVQSLSRSVVQFSRFALLSAAKGCLADAIFSWCIMGKSGHPKSL